MLTQLDVASWWTFSGLFEEGWLSRPSDGFGLSPPMVSKAGLPSLTLTLTQAGLASPPMVSRSQPTGHSNCSREPARAAFVVDDADPNPNPNLTLTLTLTNQARAAPCGDAERLVAPTILTYPPPSPSPHPHPHLPLTLTSPSPSPSPR